MHGLHTIGNNLALRICCSDTLHSKHSSYKDNVTQRRQVQNVPKKRQAHEDSKLTSSHRMGDMTGRSCLMSTELLTEEMKLLKTVVN